ncbi:MAG: hypothetical protein JNM72_06000 [Deltaproteobacteria bacterium]|nr:hypothetical protein [Deltaproteobacteria bacterium]
MSTRRWTLNEAEGRYAATNLTTPTITVELALKRSTGVVEPVGVFELDLVALAAQGFVTKRDKGGQEVFDVQIYRGASGAYTLGVRRADQTALGPFARRAR